MHVYADNNATTKIDQRVFERMIPYLSDNFANPNSTHTLGQKAKIAVDEAREIIASYLNASPVEVLFTGSATESNNWACKGVAEALQKKGKHIITTAIEHSSILKVAKHLESQGYEITYLPVNDQGHIDIDDFKNAIRDDTILVSVQYTNSEIGTIMPVRDIGKICQKKEILFHVDATQAAKYLPLNVLYLHANLLTFGAHKIYGPKGVACLFIQKKTPIVQFIDGGQQEFNLRAGTENVSHIVGFGEAVRLLQFEREDRAQEVKKIRDYFESQIQEQIPQIAFNGGEPRMPNVSNISFLGVPSDTFLARLDMEGIYASAGSACTSGSIQTSEVLTQMQLSDDRSASAIRFSFTHSNTRDEIDYMLSILKKLTTSLRTL